MLFIDIRFVARFIYSHFPEDAARDLESGASSVSESPEAGILHAMVY